jgi:hypothetical protein
MKPLPALSGQPSNNLFVRLTEYTTAITESIIIVHYRTYLPISSYLCYLCVNFWTKNYGFSPILRAGLFAEADSFASAGVPKHFDD